MIRMMKQDVTKAVILVGGMGTRLRPLTLTLPKPLISFCNKPILKYQVEKLVQAGIKEIILSLNYHSELILQEASNYEAEFNIKMIYLKEDYPLGTAGPLALAAKYLQGTSFFVCNSDICCNADLSKMLDFYKSNDCHGTILTYSVSDPTKYGLIELEGCYITSFLEKPKKIEGSGPWLINAGIYILSSEVLNMILLKETSIEKEVFPVMVAKRELTSFSFTGYWMDIGQPHDYLIGQKMELQYKKESEHFDIENNVVIGKHVKIGNNCKLKDCAIFDYAIIDDDVTIQSSIIGWNCHVKRGSFVLGMSVLGESVVIEQNIKVEGALLEPKGLIAKDIK